MLSKQELNQLKNSMIASKNSWNSVFYETFAYTQPERNYVWRTKDGNPANNKQVQLFTTAGKLGSAIFVAKIQNRLSPYQKPYFSLKIKPSVVDETESEMREFGKELTDRLNERKNDIKLDDTLNESYFDLVAGTACVQRINNINGATFHKIPLTDFCLGTEDNQSVLRTFKLPGAEVGTVFPELRGKNRIGNVFITKQNRWEKILFTDILFYNKILNQWEYYLLQDDETVLMRVYKTSPYYLFHWDRASDMPFGTGVGQKALPILKRLNSYIKCNLQLLPFRFPMFIARNNSITDRNIQYKPGGFIWTQDPQGVVPVQLSAGQNSFVLEIQQDEMEIKQIMLDNTLPTDPRQMTAAEVYSRTETPYEMLYSNISRLTNTIRAIGWDILEDIFNRELFGLVDFDFDYLKSIFDLDVNNESAVDINLVQQIQNYIATVGQIDPSAVWQSLPRSETLVKLQQGFNIPQELQRTAMEIDEATQQDAIAAQNALNTQVQAQMAVDTNKEQAIANREAQNNGLSL